jgi:hypothetical protein
MPYCGNSEQVSVELFGVVSHVFNAMGAILRYTGIAPAVKWQAFWKKAERSSLAAARSGFLGTGEVYHEKPCRRNRHFETPLRRWPSWSTIGDPAIRDSQ